jgi:polar amino acid transport system substrate-binding protein
MRPSRPYQRSGVILAVREAETGIGSLAALKPGKRVGVQVGSLVSMLLGKQGFGTTSFAFEAEPDLNWNVAVGMVKPDDKLRQGIDSALESMLEDGTIARIYARYGIELSPPQ